MKDKSLTTFLIGSIFLFLVFPIPHIDAAIYKWVDTNGKTHYTATPPKNTEANNPKEIEREIRRGSILEHNSSNTTQNQHSDNSKSSNTHTENNASSNYPKTYCAKQQNILSTLQNNTHVKWQENDKPEVVLEGQQRQEKINQVNAEIAKYCSAAPNTKKSDQPQQQATSKKQ